MFRESFFSAILWLDKVQRELRKSLKMLSDVEALVKRDKGKREHGWRSLFNAFAGENNAIYVQFQKHKISGVRVVAYDVQCRPFLCVDNAVCPDHELANILNDNSEERFQKLLNWLQGRSWMLNKNLVCLQIFGQDRVLFNSLMIRSDEDYRSIYFFQKQEDGTWQNIGPKIPE